MSPADLLARLLDVRDDGVPYVDWTILPDGLAADLRAWRDGAATPAPATESPEPSGDAARVRELEATVTEKGHVIAGLRASVPPTKPTDYGHEGWAVALQDAHNEGRKEERDEVMQYLRKVADQTNDQSAAIEFRRAAALIECYYHRKFEW